MYASRQQQTLSWHLIPTQYRLQETQGNPPSSQRELTSTRMAPGVPEQEQGEMPGLHGSDLTHPGAGESG